jgi:hypothetical protein
MKRWLPPSSIGFLLIWILVPSSRSFAGFSPIALTANSYNQDVIVEKSGPSPLIPATSASMEAGLTNTGLSYFERGYDTPEPSSGLPVAGTVFSSELDGNHDFQLAPTYKTNNAVLIDSNLTAGTLTLLSPRAFGQLSFLVAGGNGSGQVQFTIRYQDATSQTGIFTCPDWYFSLNAACVANGRVEVTAFTFDSVNSGHPGMFSRDVTLSNSLSPVTRIDFAYVSGASHDAIFALSGAAAVGDYYFPVGVRGYNADLIVEATAARRASFASATSASVEKGTLNGGKTFFEQGYYSPVATVGFPPAGSSITNVAAPDHRYALAGSYSNNNVVMVDADAPSATITLATPASFGAISLLCTAGHGPVTNDCVIHHGNGSAETNRLVIADWSSNAVAAFSPNGRVNLDNRIVDQVGTGNPRLFAYDISLVNTSSPVTDLVLNFVGGPADAHGFVFAVSGAPPGVVTPAAVLGLSQNPNGTLTLTSSQPGQLQSTSVLNGTNTVWQGLGQILSATNIVPAGSNAARFYRVSSP